MGWSIGYDEKWKRDIGYGVPAWCDHPDCNEEINRGLAYVCGGEPYGGERGCGLFFCGQHRFPTLCESCSHERSTDSQAKPDHPEWIQWKLTDESWAEWRSENPAFVKAHSGA
jgi:hypothetical protein